MKYNKAYTLLMAFLLTSTGIKYASSNTNPFQHSSPTKILFVTAISSHVLASTAEMSLPNTIFIFNLSGIVGCEVLMWILVDEFVWWCVTNVFLLLVASFCFNYYKHVIHLIRSRNDLMSNLEAQEPQI